MKKFILFTAIVMLSFKASAQVLDVSDYVTSVQMSKEFLSNLAKCTPYEENKSAGLVNIETGITYKIVGKKSDGSCEVHIASSASGMNITASQICNFSPEHLKKFIPAMLNVLKRTSYTLDTLSEAINDENNITVMEIMMDPSICHIHRDAIDMTKNFREKLKTCQPFSETQKMGPIEITRTIIGKPDSYCSVNIRVSQKKPDFTNLSGELIEKMEELLKDMPETYYDIKCSLNPEQVIIYNNILESQIIPAIDSFEDMNEGMENADPKREADFLGSNCETVYPDLQ